MKYLSILLASVFLSFTSGEEKHPTIDLGASAPMADAKMKSVDTKEYALNDLKSANGLLVIFSCNTCPFVIEWEDRYPELEKLAKASEVGMVYVNSNQAKREGDDSFDNMVAHAKEKGYTAPYVVDEHSALADAFGAKSTPHVFLFDKSMKLVYKGAIDDNPKHADQVEHHYLQDALTELGAGKTITTAESKAVGCSIKRVAPASTH